MLLKKYIIFIFCFFIFYNIFSLDLKEEYIRENILVLNNNFKNFKFMNNIGCLEKKNFIKRHPYFISTITFILGVSLSGIVIKLVEYNFNKNNSLEVLTQDGFTETDLQEKQDKETEKLIKLLQDRLNYLEKDDKNIRESLSKKDTEIKDKDNKIKDKQAFMDNWLEKFNETKDKIKLFAVNYYFKKELDDLFEQEKKTPGYIAQKNMFYCQYEDDSTERKKQMVLFDSRVKKDVLGRYFYEKFEKHPDYINKLSREYLNKILGKEFGSVVIEYFFG